MSRRTAREAAVRALFQIDVGRAHVGRALQFNLEELDLSESEFDFARTLVEGTIGHLEEIDGLIHRNALHWSIERMARTDRNILRIALYEILYQDDVPPSVAINEAVDLAKTYGEADSGRFVNGILGNVMRQVAAEPEG